MKRPSPRTMVRWMWLWPPFLGAGIRVGEVADDFLTIRVEMRRTIFNHNAVGTHFGGSLYAMGDPWYMLMLMQALGPGYLVWDRSARIRYLKPGTGTVAGEFRITPDQVDDLRSRADAGETIEPIFFAEIKDETGLTVAAIEKHLYIRRKAGSPESPKP